WSDPLVGPLTSVDYYKSVANALGRIDDSVRLFIVPGMGHCGGGEGPNTFDMLGALEQWVERGKTPDQIVASHSIGGAVDRTLPLVADATTKLTNTVFYIKLGFIALGVVNMVLIRRRIFRDPALDVDARPIGRFGRLLAATSLVFWGGAITAGRLMAYFGPVS